jgi:hypothetical protein
MAEWKYSGLPVSGYRAQQQDAVDRVNANKLAEENILRLLDGYKQMSEVDQRWLAIGRTHIEQGFMAINRSIFRPERVKLACDV